jgi:hypothetical protein
VLLLGPVAPIAAEEPAEPDRVPPVLVWVVGQKPVRCWVPYQNEKYSVYSLRFVF